MSTRRSDHNRGHRTSSRHRSRDGSERPRSRRPGTSRRSSTYSTPPPLLLETTATIDDSLSSPVSEASALPVAEKTKPTVLSPPAPSLIDDEEFERQERARRREERAHRRAEREKQREERARRRREREERKAERARRDAETGHRKQTCKPSSRARNEHDIDSRVQTHVDRSRHRARSAARCDGRPSSSHTDAHHNERRPSRPPRRGTRQTWSIEQSSLDFSDDEDVEMKSSSLVEQVRIPERAKLNIPVVGGLDSLAEQGSLKDPSAQAIGREHSSRQHSDFSEYSSTRRKRDARPAYESTHSSDSFSSLYLDEKQAPKRSRGRPHSRLSSAYNELDYYKNHRAPSIEDLHYDAGRSCCGCGGPWSRRRKWIIFASGLTLVIIIVLVAVAVSLSSRGYPYTPSFVQVNNTAAFASGGATRNSINDVKDGIGAGQDTYTYYSGKADQFPNASHWVSFESMWSNNLDTIADACGWLNAGPNNSPEVNQDIYNAIQDRANASFVDHRLILAVIMQESHGCVRVEGTTSSGGVHNPGLMQSHNGHSYSASHSQKSILAMVQDGTQGTKDGPGLAQLLNTYGNPYMAARGYNSGYIPKNGNLTEAAGATACYVSDIANRLTGWVKAETKCPGTNDS